MKTKRPYAVLSAVFALALAALACSGGAAAPPEQARAARANAKTADKTA